MSENSSTSNLEKNTAAQNGAHPNGSREATSTERRKRLINLSRPKISWEKTEKQISLIFSILLKAMLFTLLFGLVWLIYKGLTNDQYTLEEFEVPQAFSGGGYSGRVVAQQVQDRVLEIRERASAVRSDSLEITTAHAPGMNVTVMGFGFSLESLIYYARSVFGKESKTIGGELTELDQDLKLHLRVTGRPLKTFVEKLDNKNRSLALDTLLQQAAEHIMKYTDPHSLAIYQTSNMRLDDALATVRYNINSYQKEPEWAYWTWGYILTKQQNYPEAEHKFKKALDINPDLHFIWPALGGIQQLQNKRPEALETLNKAVELHADRASLWQSLAWVRISNRKYNEAVQAIDRAIELDPEKWWYYSNRGEIMMHCIRFNKRVNPDTALTAQDTMKVVNAFRKAYEISEGNTNGAMSLYQAYQFANEPDSAWKMLELSVELDPQNGYSWHIMQQQMFNKNEFQQSLEYGEKAVESFLVISERSENSEATYKRQNALNLMAMAHYSLGDFDMALKTILEAIAIDPNMSTPYTTLAEVYGFMGNGEKFYEALETALEKGFPLNRVLTMEPYTRFVDEARFKALSEKYLTKG